MLLSGRKYADHRHCSHTAVQNAMRDGRISFVVVGKRKLIDPTVADQEWDENTDPSKPRNQRIGRPKGKRRPGQPETPMNLDGSQKPNGGNGAGATAYADARAAREVYQAQKARLDLDERMGKLVRIETVRTAAYNAARKTRDHLLALPERVSTTLAALTDAAEVQHLLEDEIERICQELSGGDVERL